MTDTRPTWHKASASYANGNCVEAASLPGGQIRIRDSKDPDGPVLSLTSGQWTAFTASVKDGEFGPET